MNIGQTKVPAGITVGELFMVKSEQRQDGGMQIVYMYTILDSLEPELIGRTVSLSALHSTTGHPDGEPMVVVVTSIDLTGVAARRWKFYDRRPPELSSPQHERLVKESALLEVFQECGQRLIDLFRQPPMVLFQIVMIVPGLPPAMPELHESHTPFNESPGNHQLSRMDPLAIQLMNVPRLLGHIEGLGRLRLHTVRQFIRLNSTLQRRVLTPLLPMMCVE